MRSIRSSTHDPAKASGIARMRDWADGPPCLLEGLAIVLLVGCWKECLLLQGERDQGFAGHLDGLALLRYRPHGAGGCPDGCSHPGISGYTSYDCPEARSAEGALGASLAAALPFTSKSLVMIG